MKTKESRLTLHERLFDFITREELILPKEKILVALSGGADSVALLSMLQKLSGRLDIELIAAHLNHGIRGDEADRDERFCINMCKENGTAIETRRVSVPAEAEKTGEGLEECARRLRYDFLRECAEKHRCTKIATAHHADDNVETVLLHLIRGSGPSGLVGISPKRDNIIRPLLPFRKNELLSYLEEQNLSFVFDSTNSDVKMTRNKIRHELLDTVYEINPRADAVFSNMSKLIDEDNKYLISIAKNIDKKTPLCELKKLPFPILSRFLQIQYAEYANAPPLNNTHKEAECNQQDIGEKSLKAKKRLPQLSYVHISPITDFIKTGIGNADFSLPGMITAHVSADGIDFSVTGDDYTEGYMIPLKTGENNISQYRYKILITNDKNVAEEWQNIYKLSIPASVSFGKILDGEKTTLFVRSRCAGDSYIYGGHTRSVRRRLIDLRIPAYKRNRIPCICDQHGIIWVPNLRVADRAVPKPGDTVTYILYAETN